MMRTARLLPLLLLVASTLATACDASTAPPEVRLTEQLTFLRPAPNAPPIANPVVSFYAKRDENRDVTIYYRPRAGESDSSEFVYFRVPDGSLERRPDGSLIQPGDSVLITLRVLDPARLIIEFQPTGLRFAATRPAELEISFHEADDDLDGDGDLDGDDSDARRALSLWRQARPGDPWHRVGAVIDFDLEELEADLFGFSGYAIAF